MTILTTVIAELDQESLNAKAYWQMPGTQTMEYRSLSHYVNAILKFVTDSGARKILEFGCGSGRNLEQIHRELSGQNQDTPMHLRGIDTNAESLEFGRKKFSSDLDLILGDEKALADEPNGYYDLVYTVSVLDHLPNPAPVVRDLLLKTRRYAIFLEPVSPVETEAIGKIERISTEWDPGKSDEATPFTYFHSYSSIFGELDANVIIDIPMPTSVYKVGPFYRLYLVEKNHFDRDSACRVNNLTGLSEAMIRHAILTLSSSLRQEQSKSAKHVKEVQSAKIELQRAITQKTVTDELTRATKAEAKKREERLVADKETLIHERQEAITQKTVADELLRATKAEAKEREERLVADKETLIHERQEAITQKTVADELLRATKAEAKEREERLVADKETLIHERQEAITQKTVADELLRATKAEAKEREERLVADKETLIHERQEAITQKTVADELLRATKAEAKEREERLVADKETLIHERQEAITQKTVADELLRATKAEAKEREERLVADKESLLLERKRLELALAQSSSTLSAMQDALAEAIAESQRLLSIHETMSHVSELEAGNSLSRKLGEVLIQGYSSPAKIAPMLGKLYNIWQKSKTQSPPSILGGDSFEKVVLAYQEGGLSNVKKLLKETEISSGVRGDAYTALARHLRKQHPVDAGEAARRAYEADPRLFRRKWLLFRLSEANRVLEADSLLATLPADTQFSVSESVTINEIRGRADDERLIAARAKVDGYLLQITTTGPTQPLIADTESIQLSLARPDAYYVEKYRTKGVDAITQEIHRTYIDKKKIGANECIRAAKALRDAGIPEAEYPLIKAAKELHASPATLRAFFWAAQREKEFANACDAIHEIEQMLGAKISADEAERLRRMKVSPAYQLTVLRSVEPRKAPVLESVPNRLCYVLHNSLPYSSGGYATRSHGLADGMIQAGLDVIPLTRPGFPLDIKPELNSEEVALSDEIDGIRYMRMLSPLRSGKSMLNYVLEAADSLEEKLHELKPEVVMAASNHVTGLPALIAARRLGLKFVYEVRGLWEITRMSRESSFENTAAFVVQSLLEAAVCKEADHVFTLTEPMREELITRGVEAGKVDLLPNSCDPDRFLPREKDAEFAKRLDIPAHVPVIGYVGTFVDYEGLEDLASACAILKKQGTEFRLLLVGNENASGQERGPISEEIINIAETNGFSDWLIMPGRVPHEVVENYYSLIDIAAFPRKPWPVCEMVSPMKPLEALAMEKAVVVSSVRALDEMIRHEETGLVFRKGDIDSLAETLIRLINNSDLRHTLGKKGREWVSNHRTWRNVGRKAGLILKTGFIDE